MKSELFCLAAAITVDDAGPINSTYLKMRFSKQRHFVCALKDLKDCWAVKQMQKLAFSHSAWQLTAMVALTLILLNYMKRIGVHNCDKRAGK